MNGSGGWILVGRKTDDPRQVQRKARKEVETRYPELVMLYGGGNKGVDVVMRQLREEGGNLEEEMKDMDIEETHYRNERKASERRT